jgi:hypothetical protein
MPFTAATQTLLQLDPSLGSKKDLAKIRDNLSAIVLAGNHLWLGGDEGTHLHRMTRGKGGDFSDHRRFDVLPLLDLPDKGAKPSEIDIEGLDVDDGYVWLVGSHSRKRKKAEDDATPAENRKRLATVEADGNRFTLARVPLDKDEAPVRSAKSRTAARLEGDASSNLLTRALADDEHVGPFCTIPSKDNGLDVEGLAVRGDRVFAGLRGPVLRGWAVLLDLEVKDKEAGLRLGKPLRKHFLQLDGLGIRDLVIDRKDIYILAGPTMDLDGPVFIYHWRNALDVAAEVVVPREKLRIACEVPFAAKTDHAEGMTLMDPDSATPKLMVCYDSPAPARIVGDHAVRADIFNLR